MRVAALSIATSAVAADIIGRASIIDGDTIEIHGQRIRLFGIDAPEHYQLCEAPGHQRGNCFCAGCEPKVVWLSSSGV